MIDTSDTIPAPPSWVPSRLARQWASVVLVAVLGTSGCGGIVAGVAQLVAAFNAGNARVTEQLTRVEGKLDRYSDEVAEVKAAQGTAAHRVEALESNVAGVENRVANVERVVER